MCARPLARPYDQEGAKQWADFPWTNLAVPLRMASIVYNDVTYEASIARLPWKPGQYQSFKEEDISLLLWPAVATF
jgi:hypothetical protein